MTDSAMPRRFGRRKLLAGVTGGVAAASLISMVRPSSAAPSYKRMDPFTLGVASGDPSPNGVVLWTRLAIDPYAEDGLGGMPDQVVDVEWKLASDEGMSKVVQQDVIEASPDFAHSVHVELDGLEPGREYWYQFKVGGFVSLKGRTLTAPGAGVMPDQLRVAYASCSRYSDGYFTAYRGIANDRPDLVLHLGDYVYEYDYDPEEDIREVYGPQTVSLENYRQRYAQYHTDPDLQAAHAAAPWVAVWDDHEIDNNWAADVPEDDQSSDEFAARRANASRAYWENLPFRQSSYPDGSAIQVFRRFSWGKLATFHMLDSRQYRDDQACEDGWQYDCGDAMDDARSLLGEDQEAWLTEGFANSTARWDVLGQQVPFCQRDLEQDERLYTAMDKWDGYVPTRDRIAQAWVDSPVQNMLVLTGDVHNAWAADLKLDYLDPDAAPIGTEYITTSVSSNGDGTDADPPVHEMFEWNPHLKFYNDLRGYVSMTVTPEETNVDFKAMPYVSERGAEITTRASFVTENGKPGANQTANRPISSARQANRNTVEYTLRTETS